MQTLKNSLLYTGIKPPRKTIKNFNINIISNKKRLIECIDRFHLFPSLHPVMNRSSHLSLIFLNTFNQYSIKGFCRIKIKDLCYMMKLTITPVRRYIKELVDNKLLYKNTFGIGIYGKKGRGKITEFITPWHIHIYISRFLITKNGIPKRPTMPKERLQSILDYALYLMPKREHKDHKKTEQYRKLIHNSINTLLFPDVN